MRQWATGVGLALALCFGSGAAAATVEDQVKAVFLFNFATFVEWPPEAGATDSPEFIIGIVGEDPFGPLLDEIVANEQVEGRPMVVRRFAHAGEIQPCEILFVAQSEEDQLNEVLGRVRGRAVLTVADIPDFAEAGGMIGFSTENGRIRLNINRGVVKAGRLEVNTKLLRLARIVRTRVRG